VQARQQEGWVAIKAPGGPASREALEGSASPARFLRMLRQAKPCSLPATTVLGRPTAVAQTLRRTNAATLQLLNA
jgi:hypothetical protein